MGICIKCGGRSTGHYKFCPRCYHKHSKWAKPRRVQSQETTVPKVQKIIIEDSSVHAKKQIFLWVTPFLFLMIGIFKFVQGEFSEGGFSLTLIGLTWLALLIYFKFLRKKK